MTHDDTGDWNWDYLVTRVQTDPFSFRDFVHAVTYVFRDWVMDDFYEAKRR